MKIFLLSVLISLCVESSVYAHNRVHKPYIHLDIMNDYRIHYIDEYRKNRVKKRDEFLHVCKNKSNTITTIDGLKECHENGLKRFNAEYPDRGTTAYCELFYKHLTTEQAIAKSQQLLTLINKVSLDDLTENKNTELTVNHIMTELNYIEVEVLRVQASEFTL